jgi:WD40 repeat protein
MEPTSRLVLDFPVYGMGSLGGGAVAMAGGGGRMKSGIPNRVIVRTFDEVTGCFNEPRDGSATANTDDAAVAVASSRSSALFYTLVGPGCKNYLYDTTTSVLEPESEFEHDIRVATKQEQSALAVSGDSSTLAIASDEGDVRTLSVPDCVPMAHFKVHAKGVDNLDVSPDGRFVASTSARDRSSFLWEARGGKLLQRLTAVHADSFKTHIRSVRFSPTDPSLLFTAESNPRHGAWIAVWRRASPGDGAAADAAPDYRVSASAKVTSDAVTAMVVHNDGRIAVASSEGHVALFRWSGGMRMTKLWSTETRMEWLRPPTPPHFLPVTAMSFSDTGRYVLTASADFTVTAWPARRTGLLRLTFKVLAWLVAFAAIVLAVLMAEDHELPASFVPHRARFEPHVSDVRNVLRPIALEASARVSSHAESARQFSEPWIQEGLVAIQPRLDGLKEFSRLHTAVVRSQASELWPILNKYRTHVKNSFSVAVSHVSELAYSLRRRFVDGQVAAGGATPVDVNVRASPSHVPNLDEGKLPQSATPSTTAPSLSSVPTSVDEGESRSEEETGPVEPIRRASLEPESTPSEDVIAKGAVGRPDVIAGGSVSSDNVDLATTGSDPVTSSRGGAHGLQADSSAGVDGTDTDRVAPVDPGTPVTAPPPPLPLIEDVVPEEEIFQNVEPECNDDCRASILQKVADVARGGATDAAQDAGKMELDGFEPAGASKQASLKGAISDAPTDDVEHPGTKDGHSLMSDERELSPGRADDIGSDVSIDDFGSEGTIGERIGSICATNFEGPGTVLKDNSGGRLTYLSRDAGSVGETATAAVSETMEMNSPNQVESTVEQTQLLSILSADSDIGSMDSNEMQLQVADNDQSDEKVPTLASGTCSSDSEQLSVVDFWTASNAEVGVVLLENADEPRCAPSDTKAIHSLEADTEEFKSNPDVQVRDAEVEHGLAAYEKASEAFPERAFDSAAMSSDGTVEEAATYDGMHGGGDVPVSFVDVGSQSEAGSPAALDGSAVISDFEMDANANPVCISLGDSSDNAGDMTSPAAGFPDGPLESRDTDEGMLTDSADDLQDAEPDPVESVLGPERPNIYLGYSSSESRSPNTEPSRAKSPAEDSPPEGPLAAEPATLETRSLESESSSEETVERSTGGLPKSESLENEQASKESAREPTEMPPESLSLGCTVQSDKSANEPTGELVEAKHLGREIPSEESAKEPIDELLKSPGYDLLYDEAAEAPPKQFPWSKSLGGEIPSDELIEELTEMVSEAMANENGEPSSEEYIEGVSEELCGSTSLEDILSSEESAAGRTEALAVSDAREVELPPENSDKETTEEASVSKGLEAEHSLNEYANAAALPPTGDSSDDGFTGSRSRSTYANLDDLLYRPVSEESARKTDDEEIGDGDVNEKVVVPNYEFDNVNYQYEEEYDSNKL